MSEHKRERTCCENNRRESCRGCGKRLKELENEVAKLNGLLQNFHAIVTAYYLNEDETKRISNLGQTESL